MAEKKPLPVRVESVDTRELSIGAGLVLFSFLMPLMFNVDNFFVLRSLSRALRLGEKTDLMVAAVQLVALNSIRGIPHYVGAYFIGESVEFRIEGRGEGRSAWLINSLLIILTLQVTYWGIGEVHRIHYDFGLPAFLVCSFVLLFRRLDYQYIALYKKALLIVLFLTSFQFLDVMPALVGLPVGRGETSWDIKMASAVLEGEMVLNAVALVGAALFLLFGLLIFSQLKDENTLRELSFLREQNQAIRTQAQLNEMKNRTYQEMQYLVHDLKSPLTAVQTLVGVIKMECEMEQRAQDVEYLTRIEGAVEQMSGMISDILYEDQRTLVSTQSLLGVALAQSSVSGYALYIHVDNRVPEALVSANRILFPRALVNLMQNSAQAIPEGREPAIWLKVDREQTPEGSAVVFTVSDNGTGIREEDRQEIWGRGVSGRRSSGLGLAFVGSVVEKMGGEIRVCSKAGKGAAISIVVPEGGTER
ncbi:MAG: HAMP domain-containing histidine kinase [Lawsonibacter sp.]|nr:HAMP domain-containing histidine kinase [Lawsonibacter sp.]